MSRSNTVAKLALALAKRQQANATAAADLMAGLAKDKLEDLRASANPALDRKAGEDLVREVFAMESMVRGVFAELKDELRGKDGRNVEPSEAESLVRAVVQEIAPSLRGRDGSNATDSMVAAAVASYLRANPPKDGEDGRSVTPQELAKAVAAYLAANPPKAGKDGADATPAMVATAVAAYLKANPPKAGPPGPPPAHEVKGKKLRFKNPDGSWGSWIEFGGKAGVIYAPPLPGSAEPAALLSQDPENGLMLGSDGRLYAKQAAQLSAGWSYYATNWSTPPIQAGSLPSGSVLAYTLAGVTRYRLVPAPYVAANDAFYASFDGTALGGLIVARG